MTGFLGVSDRVSRRRFLSIAATVAGASMVPRLGQARDMRSFTWRGVALGAEATLSLQHHDAAEANAAIEASLAEVARLEAIFSLHRSDSALVRLNEAGVLDDAPGDLVVLLAEALRIAKRTNGAFDPTVQPLWALYAGHFADPRADRVGPPSELISETLKRIGWQKISIDGRRIRLLDAGMAVTLNGIAQGYITDKVGDLLKARGFVHVLVNLGEQLALGPKWMGDAWIIAIADPAGQGQSITQIPLQCGAVATSGGYGCRFDEAGNFTHILDPRTGAAKCRWASVSVLADRATQADGLSTALAIAPPSDAIRLLGGTARAFAVPLNANAGLWL